MTEVPGGAQFLRLFQIDPDGDFGDRVGAAVPYLGLFGPKRHHGRVERGDGVARLLGEGVAVPFGAELGVA